MILASAARMVVLIFIFSLMTFIVAVSTATTTTAKNSKSSGVSRDVLGARFLSLDRTTQISQTKGKSENDVSTLFTSTTPSSKHGTFIFITSKHYSTSLQTDQLQMYQHTSNASQDARNMTQINYLQNEQAVSLNKELGQLNVSEYLFLPDLFRALLQGGKKPENYRFSHTCGQDLAMYHLAWSRNETWAWSVYDSTGKRRPGLLNGMMTWSGSLEQCLNTQVTDGRLGQNASSAQVRTHFCSVFMTPPRWLTERMRSFVSAIILRDHQD